MSTIIPEIAVSDIERSRQFYEALGFVKDNEGVKDEQGFQWYSLTRSEGTVWLTRQDVVTDLEPGAPKGTGVNLFLRVEGIDELYNTLSKGGLKANIVKEIDTLYYGLREFKLADPDGYIWTVNMPVEQAQNLEGTP
jgi:predicted lactoylglutathione lyase